MRRLTEGIILADIIKRQRGLCTVKCFSLCLCGVLVVVVDMVVSGGRGVYSRILILEME